MNISTYKLIYHKLAVVATILYPRFIQQIGLLMIFLIVLLVVLNSLPVNVINSPSISSFKNALSSIDMSAFIKCIYLK